jgi:hypothetical protein
LVQDGYLRPIRVCSRQCFGTNFSNRGLDLIRAWPPHSKGALDEPKALFDLRSIRVVPILILQKHQIASVGDERLARRIVEQHQCLEAANAS